jgi:hypothetical protein
MLTEKLQKKFYPAYQLKFLAYIIIMFLFFLPSSCSVFMALKGKDQPDLGQVKIGESKEQIELQLGSPIKSAMLPDGYRVDIYEYEVGNQTSYGRAAIHGTLDLLTLGIWELAGTTYEAYKGDKYKISIKYDPNNRAYEIWPTGPMNGENFNK